MYSYEDRSFALQALYSFSCGMCVIGWRVSIEMSITTP